MPLRRIPAKHRSVITRSRWFPKIMTSGERRMMLLRVAAGEYDSDFYGPLGWLSNYPAFKMDYIPIHCEGGMSMKDADLKYLISRGFLVIHRQKRGSSLMGCPLRLTVAQITDLGREAIENGKLSATKRRS